MQIQLLLLLLLKLFNNSHVFEPSISVLRPEKMAAELQLTDPLPELTVGSVLEQGTGSVSQSQFSYHPLRMGKVFVEIFDSKQWVLLNSLNHFDLSYRHAVWKHSFAHACGVFDVNWKFTSVYSYQKETANDKIGGFSQIGQVVTAKKVSKVWFGFAETYHLKSFTLAHHTYKFIKSKAKRNKETQNSILCHCWSIGTVFTCFFFFFLN